MIQLYTYIHSCFIIFSTMIYPRRLNIVTYNIQPTNILLIKAMVYPVVMYGCKSWTTKKAEHWRIDAFLLWCWRRLLRIPWTARRSKQSTLRKSALNIHCKDWCWSWSASSTLATWCEELEKTLMLGKIEGRRRRGQQTKDDFVYCLQRHMISVW